ncbi:hypothetical protein SCHPADRAFT_244654 [Schizopora paradoxa]|uniref:Uncharacterized protein n=1 Tax=Schizopora paradoxa TaxID=27342 RepID=A0A0H2RW15_9AGAM|nr:hypothetical protein SCHPADRAFT_244654 [Schizopora paradoxa]
MSRRSSSTISADLFSHVQGSLGLARVETSSSISSDATARNLPGAGRTVGLFLDWLGDRLEAFLNKKAVEKGLGPEAVGQQIRHLRRHHLTTFEMRHEVTEGASSHSEGRALKRLCRKLLKYASSKLLSTQIKALDEIIDLATQDPVVRREFAGSKLGYLALRYNEPYIRTSTSRALSSITEVQTHDIWSGLISSLLPNKCGSQWSYPHADMMESIKMSLSRSETSFIAARYLLHAVQQVSSYSGTAASFLQYKIWPHYVGVTASNPSIIEWSNLDVCLRAVPDLVHTERYWIIPISLSNLVRFLVRAAHREPFLVSNLLAKPKLIKWTNEHDGGINVRFEELESRLDTHAGFYIRLWNELTGSADINTQLSFIRNTVLSGSTKRFLTSTILNDERMIAYCHFRLENCRWEHTALTFCALEDGPSEECWSTIVSASEALVSHLYRQVLSIPLYSNA